MKLLVHCERGSEIYACQKEHARTCRVYNCCHRSSNNSTECPTDAGAKRRDFAWYGRVYEIWVKSSFSDPGEPAFKDCARFTRTQMCLDQCGDCGPLSEIPSSGTPGNLWEGHVPCGGLALRFYGTSFNGFRAIDSKPAMGATLLGVAQQTTFSAGGVENPACTLDGGRPLPSPYAKQP